MTTAEYLAGPLRKAAVLLALVLVTGRGPGVGAAPMYTVEHLDAPTGSIILPSGINSMGQVVGLIGAEGGPEGAWFLYDNRGTNRLQATLGGSYTCAFGINDAGQVVGVSGTTAGRLVTGVDGLPHAFLYDQTGMHNLGTLGGSRSWAAGINRAGYVTGWASATDETQHAFIYHDGVMHDIGKLGGASSAAVGRAINNAGQVAGDSNPDHASWHAFLYDGVQMHDLGTLGYDRSFAHGINDLGHVVGEVVEWAGFQRAFVHDSAGMRELAPLVPGGQSAAYGINTTGQIVGFSEFGPARYYNHAALWEGGKIYDLNDLISPDSGLVLEEALCINDLGQIAARAGSQAVLLTPVHAHPPVTAAALSPPPNAARWNNSDVTVSLRATSETDDAGVASIAYMATGGQSIPPTTISGNVASFRIAVEGETSVIYYAKGKSGLAERAKSVAIRVDKIPPTTTTAPSPLPNATGGYNGDVTVALSATDSEPGSGVESITYRTTGAQPSPKTTVSAASGTIRLTITAEGETTLTYYATDVAGNIEAAKTLTIRIDKKAAPATSTSAGAPPAAYDNLCDLTRQLVANPKVADALCAKLQAAKAAATCGAKKAKKNALADFVTRVKKQKGKGLTAAQADTLIRAARAL
jgi:probable HAF family extracellular repeat protein